MRTKHITVGDIEAKYGKLTFGDLLRAHREGEEMTQVGLAKLLGISKQNLNDFENGRRLPTLSRATHFARKIGQLEALMVQLVLQEQVDKEKLNWQVSIKPKPSGRKAS